MGREVRKVPADWQHPKNLQDRYIPLLDGSRLVEETRAWDEGAAKWAEGLRDDFEGGWIPHDGGTYGEWSGGRPDPSDYMPPWPEEQCTHFVMYEDTSEGTPISPAFKTPEELARWLTDNNASAFAQQTATYEQWLATCRRGWAPSMIGIAGHGVHSGVEALGDIEKASK